MNKNQPKCSERSTVVNCKLYLKPEIMKGIIILVAIVASASAALIVPDVREFKGLYLSVTKTPGEWLPRGRAYPTYRVTVYNPHESEVKVASLVRDVLPEAEEMGNIVVDTDLPNFPITTTPFADLTLEVPALGSRTYTFTRKTYIS